MTAGHDPHRRAPSPRPGARLPRSLRNRYASLALLGLFAMLLDITGGRPHAQVRAAAAAPPGRLADGRPRRAVARAALPKPAPISTLGGPDTTRR